MIYLTHEQFQMMPYFKENIKIASNGLLYKEPTYRDAEFFRYVNDMPKIPGFVGPIDLLCDGKIYGYVMENIPNSMNIEEYILQRGLFRLNIDIISTIKEIFTILDEIHKYIIFGDVRNTNILVTGKHTYFIDWDLGKKITARKHLLSYYTPFVDKKRAILGKYRTRADAKVFDSNELTDSIKAYITSLSLIYNIDIEDFVRKNDLNTLLELLTSINADKHIIDYLIHLIELITNLEPRVDYSFKEVIDSVKLPSRKEKKNLSLILNR